MIYYSPKVPSSTVIKSIRELSETLISTNIPIMIIGDFNINIGSNPGKALIKSMDEIGISKISPDGPTTDYRTSIDYVFANIFSAHVDLYESVISDHKPLIISIK